MITVLRNALGVLGELAVRVAPQSDAERRGAAVEPLVGEDPYVFPAVNGDGGSSPAGVRVPPSTPPVGRQRPDLDVPLVIELLEPYDLKVFADHLRSYADEHLIDQRFSRRLADLLSADPAQ